MERWDDEVLVKESQSSRKEECFQMILVLSKVVFNTILLQRKPFMERGPSSSLDGFPRWFSGEESANACQ